MESDLDAPGLHAHHCATTSPRRNVERKGPPGITHPISPLPPGFQLPLFAPFCYSPYGTSDIAQQSRRLRDQVKRADRTTLARCAARVAAMAAAELAPHFLDPGTVLIPVPQCVPCDPRKPIATPFAIARSLYSAGLGAFIWPAIRRRRAVPKSAWVRPGCRPEFMDHYASLELLEEISPARELLLVDDFVTRGRTLLAAAAVLAQAVPRAHIRAFALIRTERLTPDIAAIIAPTVGIIRYLGGDAFRTP